MSSVPLSGNINKLTELNMARITDIQRNQLVAATGIPRYREGTFLAHTKVKAHEVNEAYPFSVDKFDSYGDLTENFFDDLTEAKVDYVRAVFCWSEARFWVYIRGLRQWKCIAATPGCASDLSENADRVLTALNWDDVKVDPKSTEY